MMEDEIRWERDINYLMENNREEEAFLYAIRVYDIPLIHILEAIEDGSIDYNSVVNEIDRQED